MWRPLLPACYLQSIVAAAGSARVCQRRYRGSIAARRTGGRAKGKRNTAIIVQFGQKERRYFICCALLQSRNIQRGGAAGGEDLTRRPLPGRQNGGRGPRRTRWPPVPCRAGLLARPLRLPGRQ